MKNRNQDLSALHDGELTPEELTPFLDDLHRDPVAEGETLQRYQLISKTLRGGLDGVAFMDISAAVQRSIADEQPASNVRALKPRFNLAHYTRPLTGLAIAASVAMVTVLSVRLVQQVEPVPASQLAAANPAAASAPIRVQPVNPQLAQQLQVVANPVLPADHPPLSPQMDQYLMRHSGGAGQTTLQGVMPYARAVGFDQGER